MIALLAIIDSASFCGWTGEDGFFRSKKRVRLLYARRQWLFVPVLSLVFPGTLANPLFPPIEPPD